MINVFFRVDAALHIGSGHVMRCLTLAEALSEKGVRCTFVCREFDGNLCDFIEQKGYQVHRLSFINKALSPNNKEQIVPHEHWLGVSWQEDAKQTIEVLQHSGVKVDWLIVDHYALDVRWEAELRKHVLKIMVIDDLADRKHDCDLLLDQTYGREKSEYKELVSQNSEFLLGSRYALLRQEFSERRLVAIKKREFMGSVKRIVISLGGVDEHNCTGLVLSSLCHLQLPENCIFTVILGKNFKALEEIKTLSEQLPWQVELKTDVNNIAEIMLESDLSIGAAGTTTWERCVVGLPSLVIATADNQVKIARDLAKLGVHWFIGKWDELTTDLIGCMIQHAFFDKNVRFALATHSFDICDGRGAQRVVKVLIKPTIEFIDVNESHIKLLHEWRNSKQVRQYSFNSEEISFVTHEAWVKRNLNSQDVKLLLACTNGFPIGCIRFDFHNKHSTEVSIYLSPDILGKGFGCEILLAAQKWIKNHYPDIEYINAQIKEENKASRIVFEKSNFIRYSSSYRYYLN